MNPEPAMNLPRLGSRAANADTASGSIDTQKSPRWRRSTGSRYRPAPRDAESEPAPTEYEIEAGQCVDWSAVYFGLCLATPDRLSRTARRKHPGTPDAGAAYNYALDNISADGWARLRNGFLGRGKPEHFLLTVFTRLLEEYRVRKYGRKRPPAWLARRGERWLRIYRLSCLQRMPAEAVADRLCAHGEYGRPAVLREIRCVRARVTSGSDRVGEYTIAKPVSDWPPRDLDDTVTTELEKADVDVVLRALADQLVADRWQGFRGRNATRAPRNDDDLREGLLLSHEERTVIALVYGNGCSVAAAARAIGMGRKKLSRNMTCTLLRLRAALESRGYTPG